MSPYIRFSFSVGIFEIRESDHVRVEFELSLLKYLSKPVSGLISVLSMAIGKIPVLGMVIWKSATSPLLIKERKMPLVKGHDKVREGNGVKLNFTLNSQIFRSKGDI